MSESGVEMTIIQKILLGNRTNATDYGDLSIKKSGCHSCSGN